MGARCPADHRAGGFRGAGCHPAVPPPRNPLWRAPRRRLSQPKAGVKRTC